MTIAVLEFWGSEVVLRETPPPSVYRVKWYLSYLFSYFMTCSILISHDRTALRIQSNRLRQARKVLESKILLSLQIIRSDIQDEIIFRSDRTVKIKDTSSRYPDTGMIVFFLYAA